MLVFQNIYMFCDQLFGHELATNGRWGFPFALVAELVDSEKEGNEAKAKRVCQQKVVEHGLNSGAGRGIAIRDSDLKPKMVKRLAQTHEIQALQGSALGVSTQTHEVRVMQNLVTHPRQSFAISEGYFCRSSTRLGDGGMVVLGRDDSRYSPPTQQFIAPPRAVSIQHTDTTTHCSWRSGVMVHRHNNSLVVGWVVE